MSDLQERLAKALPEAKIDAKSDLLAVKTDEGIWDYFDGIGWPIVPIILAECERLGWDWQMGRTTGFPGGKFTYYWAAIRNATIPIPMGDADTPPEALAEAFCVAVETVALTPGDHR